MKCIKFERTTSNPGTRVVRVSDKEAAELVAKSLAYYVAKNVWKAQRALEQKEVGK